MGHQTVPFLNTEFALSSILTSDSDSAQNSVISAAEPAV